MYTCEKVLNLYIAAKGRARKVCLLGNHLSCLRGFLVKSSVINKGVSQTDLAQIQILPLTNPKLFSPFKTDSTYHKR